MRYFATENGITTADKSGDSAWIEITEAQYLSGVEALSSGREVIIEGGFTLRDKQPSPDYEWQNGEWVYVPPVDPPEPEPMLVASPWQIRKALNHFGIRDQVEAHIANADQDTKDAWEWATEFREDNPFVSAAVVALAPTLNMTEAEAEAFKHQIFTLAVTL